MAAYDTLRAAIDNYIKANGNKEITGTVLNDILNAMVSALGADTRFAGVAVPSTNPGNPEGNVVYFASHAGTYSNFGGIVLPLGIHILVWNGTAWTSQTWFSVDNTPTQNSQNLALSGGILQAIVDAVGVERLRAIGVEVTSCSFDSTTKKISFFNSANSTLFQLDATAFVIDGMVSDVKIEDGNLVIQFNIDAGKQDIEIPLTDIFNPTNYYTKTAIDALLALYYTKTEVDGLLSTINTKLADGYLYKGIATPATSPATPATKEFYLATIAGTYTNFGNIVVKEGITILKYDGTNWTGEQLTYTDGVFDISAYNGTSYADLSAALGNGGANIPQNLRKGGMSVKFVQSSDNKYVQYRLMSDTFSTTESDWQGVDDEPTAGSENLVKSGGVILSESMIITAITGKINNNIFVDSGIPYYTSSGTASNNSYRQRTPLIKVTTGDVYKYFLSNSTNVLMVAAFDSNGDIVVAKSVAGTGNEVRGTYTVPEGVSYLQFCATTTSTPAVATDAKYTDDVPTIDSTNLVKSGGVRAYVDQTKEYVINTRHIYNDVFAGGINNSGEVVLQDLYYHTALLPLKDGMGYVVNMEINKAYYYSAPYFNSDSYLGSTNVTHDSGIPSNAKFVSYSFHNKQSYDSLCIVSRKDISDFLGNTDFLVDGDFDIIDEANSKRVLSFVKYAIKGFYLHGTDVDVTKKYKLRLNKWDGSEVRLLILDGTTSVLDKTISVVNGMVDTTLTQGNYNLRIIIDTTGMSTFLNQLVNNDVLTAPSAFSSFVGNIKQIETDVNEINEIVPTINDSNYINVETKEFTEEDYSNYLTPQYGAEGGTISASTGVPSGNNTQTRTTYIDIGKIKYIKAKTQSGSGGGGAFYTGNDVSQAASQYISGFAYSTGGDGNTWIPVPPNAKYFRVCEDNSDISGGTAVLKIMRAVTVSLQQFVNSKASPRNTHVLYGFEGFVTGIKTSTSWEPSGTKLNNSRNQIVVSTEDDDAKQIFSQYEDYFNRYKFEASFELNDTNSFFGIGIKGLALNELRVHNDNGSCLFEIYTGGGGDDTIEQTTRKVVVSRTMSFALAAGNIYKLGIRMIEDETYNNVEHMDGVVYYIQSYADNVLYEEFVPRNGSKLPDSSGNRNGINAYGKGSKYISVKFGDVTVDNLFVSSPYDPQAKVLMIGDSYTDGDTLIGTDPVTGCGQKNKLACLLQSAIGENCFVIAGKGGDGAFDGSFLYQAKEIYQFLPKYVILQFGGNHHDYSMYVNGMTRLINYVLDYGIEPVLVTPVPCSVNSSELTIQMCQWVRSSGYRYVDTSMAVTVDGAGETWKDGYVNADNTHPTPLGHQAMYEAFVRELPELFAV